MTAGRWRAVLFDLDGTLIDSAPDLAGAANDMRLARGLSRRLMPCRATAAGGGLGRPRHAGQRPSTSRPNMPISRR